MKTPSRPTPSGGQRSPAKARKSSRGSGHASLDSTLHEWIAKRAYELYERRIRQGALDDWLQAEQEILKEARAKRKAPKAGK